MNDETNLPTWHEIDVMEESGEFSDKHIEYLRKMKKKAMRKQLSSNK